jgi:hypothetical protein
MEKRMEPFKTVLGIKADTVTANGRLYPKEVLEKAFAAKDNLFITNGSPGVPSYVDLSQVIGSVDYVEIQDDGEITIAGKSFFPLDDFKLHPDGVGNIDAMGIVSDFGLVSISISGVSASPEKIFKGGK